MKKLALFCLLALFVHHSYSQYINTSYNDAQEVKKRTLLVVLPEDNKDIIASLEQESEAFVALYKNDMEGQRQALKWAVLNCWKLSHDPVITSMKEARSLIKASPDKYALMKVGEQFQDRYYIKSAAEPAQTAWEKIDEKFIYNFSKRYNVRMLGITTLTIEIPKKIMEIYLPKISPSEGDYLFALKQMQYTITKILESEGNTANKLYRSLNPDQLKNKIVLLDAMEVDGKTDDIKKIYPYPFKITNYKEVENVIRANDTSYAVIQCSRFDGTNSNFIISNAGNGKIYSYFTGLTFHYGQRNGSYSIKVIYPKITRFLLERFVSGN